MATRTTRPNQRRGRAPGVAGPSQPEESSGDRASPSVRLPGVFHNPKQSPGLGPQVPPPASEGVPDLSPDGPRGAQEWLTRPQLAQRMGVKVRQVDTWRQDGCPTEIVGGDRRFPWPDAMHWYMANVKAGGRPAGAEQLELEEARARKATADAKLAELELAKQERQLLPVAEVDQVLTDLLLRIQGKVLNVPSKYAARILNLASVGAAMAVLDGIAQEILGELQLAADDDLEDAA